MELTMINEIRNFSLYLLVAITSSLFAVNVTLNVDMSNVTVSENGVHVAGSFQGWDPAATPLTDEDGDGASACYQDCDDNDASINPISSFRFPPMTITYDFSINRIFIPTSLNPIR